MALCIVDVCAVSGLHLFFVWLLPPKMELPATIDVEEFLTARRQETQLLLNDLAQLKKGKRSFQQLHFEQRYTLLPSAS